MYPVLFFSNSPCFFSAPSLLEAFALDYDRLDDDSNNHQMRAHRLRQSFLDGEIQCPEHNIASQHTVSTTRYTLLITVAKVVVPTPQHVWR
jgi:hypothetical protein